MHEQGQNEPNDIRYDLYHLLILYLLRSRHLIQQIRQILAHSRIVEHVNDLSFVFQ